MCEAAAMLLGTAKAAQAQIRPFGISSLSVVNRTNKLFDI